MGIIIVGGVVEKDGKYLLVQEAKEKCRGKWNLPAGHLEQNETIIEAAKREVLEETGCDVELTGVLQIGNMILKEDTLISVIFSTKLIKEDIKYNKDELLDVKWFTYEEIINMQEQLRQKYWIINSIRKLKENKISDLSLVETQN